MTKYRIEVSSSVVIEADSPAEAEREFVAARESIEITGKDTIMLLHSTERDLLLNAKIERLAIEEPWQE
jgi:hypothetical protein